MPCNLLATSDGYATGAAAGSFGTGGVPADGWGEAGLLARREAISSSRVSTSVVLIGAASLRTSTEDS